VDDLIDARAGSPERFWLGEITLKHLDIERGCPRKGAPKVTDKDSNLVPTSGKSLYYMAAHAASCAGHQNNSLGHRKLSRACKQKSEHPLSNNALRLIGGLGKSQAFNAA
jgi:hypothetical protein